MRGEIVWYLPSASGHIVTIRGLQCHYVVVLHTPNLALEEAHEQDLYHCAIVSTPSLFAHATNIEADYN